jgi:hypothetical protein
MSVYVDQPIHTWRNKKWCNLVADDLNELHAFAVKLGLKKEWFQKYFEGEETEWLNHPHTSLR